MFKHLLRFKDNLALFDKENKIFYKDFFQKEKKFKNEFNSKKLVLIICENNIAVFYYYIIMHLLKSSIMLIDFKMQNSQIKEILKKYEPDFLVCNLKRKKNLKINFKLFDKLRNYCIFKNPIKKKTNINNKVSILMPTSGSMGSPKFVILSYENLQDNTKKICNYLNIVEKDITVTNMSLSYSYMLSVINSHISSGSSIFVTDKSILTREFWKDFKKYKISSFNGVPYAYKIIERLGINDLFNINVRYLTQAGGELDLKLKKKFTIKCNKKKIKFFCMYGQTEASPRISYLDPKLAIKKIGSIGKPLRNYKIKLLGKKNQFIVKSNKIGKLILFGKNVFLGYATCRKDLAKIFKAKLKLNTEDYGYKDKDGFFYLTSRAVKIAKIFGFRIDISQLEYKMKKAGFIIYCKEKNGYLKISYEKRYKKDLLIKKLSNFTNLDQSGFITNYVNKLPLNNNQKIDRNRL